MYEGASHNKSKLHLYLPSAASDGQKTDSSIDIKMIIIITITTILAIIIVIVVSYSYSQPCRFSICSN